MKERGILFSAPMVKAILDGRKTQTRRIVRSEHVEDAAVWADCRDGRWESGIASGAPGSFGHGEFVRCPFGIAGDRLWVRETWTHDADSLEDARAQHEDAMSLTPVYYRAGMPDAEADTFPRWRPSIFMPRWASPFTLEVTEVRVQRLCEITEDDARAEGVTGDAFCNHRITFSVLWDQINGKRAPWSSNPWVWALTFQRVTP